MTTDRQPKEMLTVKELAEFFGISRQAMRKHVDNLEPTFLAKNSQGYKTVLWSGVLHLADKLGRPELLEAFEIPDTASSDSIETKLFAQLQQKDAQIDQLQSLLAQQQKLLDQQQQLTLQANKQILLLTSQGRLSGDLNKESNNDSENFKTPQNAYESLSEQEEKFTSENEVVRPKQERKKKWWHFFREP
ncbi:hypothetical protein [Enterococcus sp. AZ154]|uniref:hypothetical protein n=1 Tax=Enterococcus sp. AZ154 TaxID=2774683 RepID=UPI003D2DB593